MYQFPILETMPQVEEEVARRAARVAWSAGMKEKAEKLFLAYLTVARTAEMDPLETEIRNALLASGLASADRLTLFSGKRLLSLGNYNEARSQLTQAQDSQEAGVRSEAGLFLARVERILDNTRSGRRRVVDLLSSVLEETTQPAIAEQALFDRAKLLGNEDLEQLVESYPQGRNTSEALFKLGQHYQYVGDADKAIGYFERVRKFEGQDEWRGKAAFLESITLYTRGDSDDFDKASALLQDLSQEPSALRPAALFWLGRIKEDSGDQERANGYFKQVIEETPYDYFATRARIHLNEGKRACGILFSDPKTTAQLHDDFRNSVVDASLAPLSPYHVRLNAALDTGLYSHAFASDLELRRIFPSRRLEDLSYSELDDTGLLPYLALLLALRQDAAAAKDTIRDPVVRLQIAGALGQKAQDWPMVMSLFLASGEPFERKAAAQRDRRYLATAYPPVYARSFREAGTAWKVSPALLYGVALEESMFDPAALSRAGALGLFQFTPGTFKDCDAKWNLLKSRGIGSREEFLLNPDWSIDLGARWFHFGAGGADRELNETLKGGTQALLAVMKHNAGASRVRRWVSYWKRIRCENDIECMVETIPDHEVWLFIRRIVNDISIVEAAGILNDDS
jgi:soluble lytic murein transglycosylase-like protein/tetratricopeptide (TPR) repeat protein